MYSGSARAALLTRQPVLGHAAEVLHRRFTDEAHAEGRDAGHHQCADAAALRHGARETDDRAEAGRDADRRERMIDDRLANLDLLELAAELAELLLGRVDATVLLDADWGTFGFEGGLHDYFLSIRTVR